MMVVCVNGGVNKKRGQKRKDLRWCGVVDDEANGRVAAVIDHVHVGRKVEIVTFDL